MLFHLYLCLSLECKLHGYSKAFLVSLIIYHTAACFPIDVLWTEYICSVLSLCVLYYVGSAFVWYLIRKRAKKTTFADNNTQSTANNNQQTVHELQYKQYSTSQRLSTEHIYSVPQHVNREACSSMIYNQAYKGSFAVTINAAYTPTMNKYKWKDKDSQWL